MVILAVDNDPDRLWALVKSLRLVFPNDTVEYTHDSLMAGKFCNSNQVDMLFASFKMRVLDGEELKTVVSKKFPDLKVFLLADGEELNRYFYDENDGYVMIQRPVTEEEIRSAATQMRITG